jgi:DNA invertase Pin-like site-specific DNA recombinase
MVRPALERYRSRQPRLLQILGLGIDTGTATGFTIMGIACFEREMTLERQREGIGKAKAERRCRGRKPTARANAAEVEALAE